MGLFGGLNGNQLNVVNAIGDFFNNGGKLPPGFVSVFGLTGGNFASALTELSGKSATGAQQSAFQLTTGFLGLMTDPFSDGRGGPGGGVSFYAADDSERSAELASAFDAVTKRRRRAPRRSRNAGIVGDRPSAAPAVSPAIPAGAAARTFRRELAVSPPVPITR